MGVFSKKDNGEKAATIVQKTTPSPPPPSYQPVDDTNVNIADLTAALTHLDLDQRRSQTSLPSNDECIAHLKFLTALAHLREEISESGGLFGISDTLADSITGASSSPRENVLIKIREKRWAVFVTRAVDRFQKWWDVCVPCKTVGTGANGTLSLSDMQARRLPDILKEADMSWNADLMPPLDVLMVLHSFMLNPRDFLEDCIRFCKLPVWHAGMPWAVIDKCIDNASFEYSANDTAHSNWESRTGYTWENTNDPLTRTFECFRCKNRIRGPITEAHIGTNLDAAFGSARGFADKSFSLKCPHCQLKITHDVLRLLKFRGDMEELLKHSTPMPGSILSRKGLAEDPTEFNDFLFPSWLIQTQLNARLLELTDKNHIESRTFEDVRKAVETTIISRSVLKEMASKGMKNPVSSRSLMQSEGIAVRRMMSRYWDNSSPFALDLVGAVLRQGIFVDKMARLDWIHSPALASTISRLIEKYKVFFRIMAENPGHMAVPTLDVDLAWHTHQLSPRRYYTYSVLQMKDEFIDHNDKIDEVKLSDNFAWTSKMYQKITQGGIYSECTCWYCEAIRESTYSTFSSSSNHTKKNALSLHDDPNISSDPNSNPHISAHNAVRTESLAASRVAAMQRARLQTDYERAVKRAKKSGKTPPRRDDYVYAYAWGYPMFVPIGYYPYAADPCVSGSSMYAYNPSCTSASCAMGSCGGLAAAGGCAGGVAGSCAGAGGGAACGGVGGGGCGGGGGGGGGCGGGGGG